MLTVGLAVWLVAFSPGDEAAPLLPDTETAFSLDLRVIDAVDHDIVYAVEQRARPKYRIFSFDPENGQVETVFTVPEDAIIFGIALNPDRDALAVSYSPDFALEGSGVSTLDLATQEMTEIVPVTPGLYLTDPAWAPDAASILATQVDRRGADEILSSVRVDTATGSVSELSAEAINPVQIDDSIYFLTVDENQARRAIGTLNTNGSITSTTVVESADLDHLLASGQDQTLRVAVLETTDGGISLGEDADAHGNHDVASQWWSVQLEPTNDFEQLEFDPIIVYDAALTNGGSIVYATQEGLAIGETSRVDVIKSRAIRFVAG